MREKAGRTVTGRWALRAAGAVVAVVAACDAPMPTEVLEPEEVMEAPEEVMAEDETAPEEETADETAQSGSEPEPLLFVDGVRIRTESVFSWLDNRFGNRPRDIERMEVLRGRAVAVYYGDENAFGVIQIFTKGAESARESTASR